MIDAKSWIEHLSEPLVLAGFGLFIFATLATVILKQRSAVSANAKLAVMMSFALALIIVVGGVWLADKKADPAQPSTPPQALEQKPPVPAGTGSADNNAAPADQKSPATVSQETKGDQSPAVQSGGDVNINFGGKP